MVVTGNGKIEQSTCKEVHIFKPFSAGSSGATTQQTQVLRLTKEFTIEELPTPEDVDRRSNLLFQHQDKDPDQRSNDEGHVNEILEAFQVESEDFRPALFSDLVHTLRRLSHSQLVKTFYGITNNELRRFVFDAIPLLKTDAGIVLMRDIIDSGALSIDTLDTWYSTLPFYKNPTRAMIATVSVSHSNIRIFSSH